MRAIKDCVTEKSAVMAWEDVIQFFCETSCLVQTG